MLQNEKVSIIIPVYNAEKTIKRCIDSIIDNTYKNYEIILVNDGSIDQSEKICLELQKNNSKIKYFKNKKNSGVSYTRNKGINVATGKYMIFIDSDDWVENNYIETLVSAVVDNKGFYNFVITGYINDDKKFNNQVTKVNFFDTNISIKIFSLKKYIIDFYEANLLGQLWNKIFVSEYIKNSRIYFDENLKIGEDLKFILAYLKNNKFENIYYVNCCLYHYMRVQENSLMYQVNENNVATTLNNMTKLYQLIGFKDNEINQILIEKKQAIVKNNAYLVFHNNTMSFKEKKEIILKMDEENGKQLYKANRILFFKERCAIFVQKIKEKFIK